MANMNSLELREITRAEYDNIMVKTDIVYHKSAFIELNKNKVDEIKYVAIFKETSPKFTFPIGVKEGIVKMPFSAPFTYPEAVSKRTAIEYYEWAEECIVNYMKEQGWSEVWITFPPALYDEVDIAAWENVLFRRNWKVDVADLNYSIDLARVQSDGYESMLDRNGKRNLRMAEKAGLEFMVCDKEDEYFQCYNVIRENRRYRGFPLRMSYEQVRDTMQIVKSNMYLVRQGETNVAAALVYEVNSLVAQVIYWGNTPGSEEYKPVNFIAKQLVELYSQKGLQILDIGISTEEGIPNYGLCDFKERIGCIRTIKKKWSRVL